MIDLAPEPPVDLAPEGDLYLRELIRLQLQLSVVGLVAFGGLVGALPLALLVVPALAHTHLGGVPLALVLLGPPPFALFLALGWLYRRRADALDVEFRDLVRLE